MTPGYFSAQHDYFGASTKMKHPPFIHPLNHHHLHHHHHHPERPLMEYMRRTSSPLQSDCQGSVDSGSNMARLMLLWNKNNYERMQELKFTPESTRTDAQINCLNSCFTCDLCSSNFDSMTSLTHHKVSRG